MFCLTLRGGMTCILHFMFIQLGIVMSMSGAESETGRDFLCYNDYYNMSCQFRPSSDHPNCSEYILDMTDEDGKTISESCNFQSEEGPVSECKCSFEMILVICSKHNATLLRGGQQLDFIVVDIIQTLKPRPPTITSVKITEIGNIEITWDKNYKDWSASVEEDLTALVIYRKKGGKISTNVTVNSSTSLEILGKLLEPNTEYVVRVLSYLYWGRRYSDSSDERSFTTPPSFRNLLVVLIVILCVVVVIVISIVLCCYARLKEMYWDNIPKCQSKLLTMGPAEHKLLKPLQAILSSVYLDSPVKDPDEGKRWSGLSLTDISDGNYGESCGNTTDSSLSYAKTFSENFNIIADVQAALRQALPNLTLPSSMTDSAMTSPNDDGGLVFVGYAHNDLSPTSGSLSYDNKTYAILLPSCQNELICGSDEMQMQPEISCGPVCQLREGDISINTCPDPKTLVGLITRQQGLNLQLGPTSPMQTDFSYQPCDVYSGSISQPENGRLTSSSSDSDASVSSNVSPSAESGYESFSEAVRGGSHTPPEKTTGMNGEETQLRGGRLLSFPPVDMDYQAWASPVTQPDMLFGGQTSAADPGDLLDRVSKELHSVFPHTSLGSVPPNVTANAQRVQGLPELAMPHDLPTDQWKSMVTDNCYHSV